MNGMPLSAFTTDLPYDANAKQSNGRFRVAMAAAHPMSKYKGVVAVVIDPALIKPDQVETYIAKLSTKIAPAVHQEVSTVLRQSTHAPAAVPPAPQMLSSAPAPKVWNSYTLTPAAGGLGW
jgi:hypothetical protein